LLFDKIENQSINAVNGIQLKFVACCQIHTKQRHKFCGKNAEFFSDKSDDECNNHRAVEGELPP
jgi:hypothetical protein